MLTHLYEFLYALILKGKYSWFFIQGITYPLLKFTHLKQCKLNKFNLIHFKHNGMDSVSHIFRYGGVISKQNPYTETLQKTNSNFTYNTHPFRLKITSKTYFNYFLYSEYQFEPINLKNFT